MGILAREADTGRGGNVLLANVGNMLVTTTTAKASHFAALLRGVVFVGEAALGRT